MKTLLPLLCILAFAAAPVRADDSSVNLRRTTIVDVVEKTKNAVVYISSKKMTFVSNFPNDPFWREFGQMRLGNSLGSGFIVHPDGYIVTNNHVIDRARQIGVELLDGRKFEAELISADQESDLAILKINDSKPLPALELGDSADLMIGEPVIAVGNPLGFSNTVSTGIVSAMHRDLSAGNEKIQLKDLIQTDAAINPGNSGGPLLNAYGQVIGINTAVVNAQNIGFAIQVNRLREMIPELMDPTVVNKVQMPLTLRERRKFSPPATVEPIIERVVADKTAIVNSIAGRKPRDIVDAYAIVLAQKDRPFDVELAGEPTLKVRPNPVPPSEALVKAKSKLGLTVEAITPMLAERFKLPVENGMLVMEVTRGSPAEKAGIQPNDVILQIGIYRVTNLTDFAVLLQNMPDKGAVTAGILRGQQVGRVRMQL